MREDQPMVAALPAIPPGRTVWANAQDAGQCCEGVGPMTISAPLEGGALEIEIVEGDDGKRLLQISTPDGDECYHISASVALDIARHIFECFQGDLN